jgi:hypothetical protein
VEGDATASALSVNLSNSICILVIFCTVENVEIEDVPRPVVEVSFSTLA